MCDDLANAIIERAANDFKTAFCGYGYDGRMPQTVMDEVERFFRSDWFKMLTKTDGEILMKKLKEDVLQNEIEVYERALAESCKIKVCIPKKNGKVAVNYIVPRRHMEPFLLLLKQEIQRRKKESMFLQ